MRKVVLIGALLSLFALAKAQDVHYSQFLYSPFTLNPALTGDFDGRYRLGFNHRQQWRSISKPFQTTGLWADSRNFLNVKNTNVGINLNYDVAGITEYNTIHVSIPLSYRIKVSKDSVHHIQLGAQPGFNYQSINTSNITTDAQWNGYQHNPNTATNESLNNTNFGYFDLAVGVSYHLNLNKSNWTAGFGMSNLFQPKKKFTNDPNAVLPRRYNIHVGGKASLGAKWFATPGLVYSRQERFQEFLLGSEINYILNPAPYKYRVLFAGIWNRGNDAAIGNLGMYYNNWRVAFSYDLNYSPLHSSSNYRGGWEVSVIYILRDLLPKRNHFKYCPNYI